MLASDAHLEAREAFVWYDHAEAGHQRTTRPVWRMARRPITSVCAAPRFGADTAEVLERLLGYAPAQIEALAAKHVTSTALTE